MLTLASLAAVAGTANLRPPTRAVGFMASCSWRLHWTAVGGPREVRGVGREPLEPCGSAWQDPPVPWRFFVTREERAPSLRLQNAMVLVGARGHRKFLLPLLRRRMDGILQDWADVLELGAVPGGTHAVLRECATALTAD